MISKVKMDTSNFHSKKQNKRWFGKKLNKLSKTRLRSSLQFKKQTKEDMRIALEAKERKHLSKTKGINFEEERKKDLLLLEAPSIAEGAVKLVPKAIDADDEEEEDPESSDDDDDEVRVILQP